MAKKVYRIEVKAGWMFVLLRELQAWGARGFTIEGENAISTSDKNVVDVATETFIKVPHLVTITVVEGGVSHAREKRGIQDHALPRV